MVKERSWKASFQFLWGRQEMIIDELVVYQVPLHTVFFAHFYARRFHGNGCHGDDVMTLRHASHHDLT